MVSKQDLCVHDLVAVNEWTDETWGTRGHSAVCAACVTAWCLSVLPPSSPASLSCGL